MLRFLRIILVTCAIFNRAKCGLENNATIIIIGAGASGIAAATRLLENGFINVKVLEAEDRIGGRIHSVKFGDAFVDLGAEYCLGEKGNVVFSLANELGLLKPYYQSEYEICYSANGMDVGAEVRETLLALSSNIFHRKSINTSEEFDVCEGTTSVGACLETHFNELVNCAEDDYTSLLKLSYTWIRNYLTGCEGCLNLDDASVFSDYEPCDGHSLHWRGLGFKTILDILMHKHPAQKNKLPLDVNILLNNKVSKIVSWQNASQVNLELQGGQQYSADHVIFTPSLGVLKGDHGNLFVPSLPKAKTFAINNIGYGSLVKLALYFNKPWWMMHDSKIWGCVWSCEHNFDLEKYNLTWVRHFVDLTTSPPNFNVFIAWFAGEATVDMEFLTDHDILRGVRFILSKCFITYPGLDMPKILRSNWWRNPNFRGTTSYDSAKGFSTGLRDKLGSPILNENGVPTLLFAGEATHRTKFCTVHGAIETGYREADRLINYYKNRT